MSNCHTSKIVTARKHHRCCESFCRRTVKIMPGDRYVRHSGIWEDQPYSYKLCLRCDRAHRRVWERKATKAYIEADDPPCGGELLDWLKEARAW